MTWFEDDMDFKPFNINQAALTYHSGMIYSYNPFVAIWGEGFYIIYLVYHINQPKKW